MMTVSGAARTRVPSPEIRTRVAMADDRVHGSPREYGLGTNGLIWWIDIFHAIRLVSVERGTGGR